MEPRKLERAIVIYDSKFGNTGQVARSLADGLQKAGVETSCFNMRDVKAETLSGYDLIAVGGPTQAFSASKPMKDFLEQLDNVTGLKGKQGFAFDTKFASRLSGSAAKYIESKLSKLGLEIVKTRQSAIVKKSEGPLEEGEPESFERLGFEIGSILIGKQ
jgi:flavodoxin